MTTLSLPSQFEVECLKRYLKKHPEQATSLAIIHFQDYLELVSQYQKLEKKLQSSSLPTTTKHAKLQISYYKLLKYCIQLQRDCVNLRKDNKALTELIDILARDLPLSLEKEQT